MRKFAFSILLTLGVAALCHAQPGSNPGGGGRPGVPISGIEYLLLGGGIIGARKLTQLYKNKPTK